MAKESSLVGHMAAPSCKVNNPVPNPPIHAPNNLYPGPGPDRVNNSPGNSKLQVTRAGDKGMPMHSEPSGSEL